MPPIRQLKQVYARADAGRVQSTLHGEEGAPATGTGEGGGTVGVESIAMRRLLPLHLGLIAGCMAGLAFNGARTRSQPVPMVGTENLAPPNPVANPEAWQQRAHVHLVDQSRMGLHDPQVYCRDMILERVDFRGARGGRSLEVGRA